MNLETGDLSGLVLPQDLERLRGQLQDLVDDGKPLTPAYEALAAEAPVALVDLVLGPKAPAGPLAVRGAMAVLETLAAQASPAGTIKRLGDLAPELRADLLGAATGLWPSAGWLVALSQRFDSTPVGHSHLEGTRTHPAYPGVCVAHARAGHLDALHSEAAAGHPEALAALALVDTGLAAKAAGALLSGHPEIRVVPWLAASLGPDTAACLIRVVPLLRSRAAAEGLMADLAPFPSAQALLAMVLGGMRA